MAAGTGTWKSHKTERINWEWWPHQNLQICPSSSNFSFYFFLSESSWFYCLHNKVSLELDHLALSLLITSQFKMLASLNSQHPLRSAVGLHTFQSQHNLLCSFRLFAENRLSLPTIATLFPVITPLSLGIQRIFALLVLGHFVGLVLATFLAECTAGLRNERSPCWRVRYRHRKKALNHLLTPLQIAFTLL